MGAVIQDAPYRGSEGHWRGTGVLVLPAPAIQPRGGMTIVLCLRLVLDVDRDGGEERLGVRQS
jgi:hypothetical protein